MSEPDHRRDTVIGSGSSAVHPDRPTADPTSPPPVASVAEQPTDAHPHPAVDATTAPPGVGQGPPERATWHRDADTTTPAWSTTPVAVRRADPVAALLLLLAGIAAGISLLVPWTPDGPTGLSLARLVVEQLTDDWTGLVGTGRWQPGAVLAGGALLFLIGLLLLVPAKAHRFLGVVALLVAAAVVAGVLVPLGAAGWRLDRFDVGFWFAMAVAGLGLLGALKAALTGPRIR